MTRLTAEQERLCGESPWDFSDLTALYVNCTLALGVGRGLPLRLREPGLPLTHAYVGGEER